MSEYQSDFRAGFSARQQGVADALQAAFAGRPDGFEIADMKARASGKARGSGGPVSFSPQGAFAGPKHFSPADASVNPTEGWDPFAATADSQPFADPIATAHAAGYAEGMAVAIVELGSTAERDRALLLELGAALQADGRLDREGMARQLRETVLFLVAKLVGEVGIAPEMLARRIDSAVEMLADHAESAMLRVHPDDVVLLEDKLPKTVFAVGDAHVARGSFVLESASTIIEDGPELWLEQLALAIERVGVPE